MKRILKSELDKFYTKAKVALSLISKINFSKYELVVDPCCGDGSFITNISHKNKISIDISPDLKGAIKSDFLSWDHTSIGVDRSKVIVISNPPFGKQGSIAMSFIKKSSQFADTIAFILPLSFSKPSMKNKIPDYYHLDYEEILPENSYLLDGESYSVKCVFQIWKKSNQIRQKIKSDEPIGFSYTKNKSLADLSIRRVGVYAGKGFLDTNKSQQSHYFLILKDKSMINLVIDELGKVNWNDLTVGPRSIAKGELNKIINEILWQKNKQS